jgi:hypothetical protein
MVCLFDLYCVKGLDFRIKVLFFLKSKFIHVWQYAQKYS